MITLSASKIKTLQKCSWEYYCQYVLKVPELSSNMGASRGSVCHYVLENLLPIRRKPHFDAIMKCGSPIDHPSIGRLIERYAKKEGVISVEDKQMVNEMILVGLQNDFYCEGSTKLLPEYKFKIENENPKYVITGIMDKLAFFPAKCAIYDYKSSKQKFSKEELTTNLQAMLYSLATRSLFKMPCIAKFIFLRFPKKPIQEIEYKENEINGFEHYLAYLTDYLTDYKEDKARSDFAGGDQARKWMCGSAIEGKFCCNYRKSYPYYKVIKSQEFFKCFLLRENALADVAKDGGEIKVMHHNGCPFYQKSESDDIFI